MEKTVSEAGQCVTSSCGGMSLSVAILFCCVVLFACGQHVVDYLCRVSVQELFTTMKQVNAP